MPKVTAFTLPGVDLHFYTNDHAPPHFHAVRPGEWHYRVHFLFPANQMLEQRAGPGAIRGTTRRLLTRLVTQHRVELIEQWESTRSDD